MEYISVHLSLGPCLGIRAMNLCCSDAHRVNVVMKHQASKPDLRIHLNIIYNRPLAAIFGPPDPLACCFEIFGA